jgi:TetR/AcrR family transcriptional regulator, cholesterol catabolism regulator
LAVTRRGARSAPLKEEVNALKRERILTEARALFFERGYQGTTLDAVAERLHVTKPVIYAHWTNKAELLAEICERGTKYSLEAVERAVKATGSPKQRLSALVEEMSRVIIDHQANVTIFFREEKHVPPESIRRIDAWRSTFDDRLSSLLQAGADSGDFKVQDARLASLAIGGVITWMYAWYRPHGRLSPEELGNRISRLVLNMVGAS